MISNPSKRNHGTTSTHRPNLVAHETLPSTTCRFGRDWIEDSHIRLFRLDPAKESKLLHGKLETYEFTKCPDFEVVSCAWQIKEADDPPINILFLGEAWTIFPITANCADALHRIRKQTVSRLIWIESICVDLHNIDEKSEQAKLLPLIYSKAKRVLLILPPTAGTRDVISQRLSQRQFYIDNSWKQRWAEMNPRLKHSYFFGSWTALAILAARAICVIDETGPNDWSIEDLRVWGQQNHFLPWLKKLELYREAKLGDLASLLVDSWSAQASDPRDKVFALLGAVASSSRAGIAADYSLSVAHVYTGVAAAIFTKYGNLDLLRYAGYHMRHRQISLPTWVPDWQTLSLNWDEMHALELFQDEKVLENVISNIELSKTRTEPLRWPTDPARTEDITVHRDTAALSIPALKIHQIDRSKYASIRTSEGFVVFPGEVTVIGNHEAQNMDEAFLLPGLDQPMLLRPQRNSGIYTLVGMCHVRQQTGLTPFVKKQEMDSDIESLKSSWPSLADFPARIEFDPDSNIAGHYARIRILEKLKKKEFHDFTELQTDLCEYITKEMEKRWITRNNDQRKDLTLIAEIAKLRSVCEINKAVWDAMADYLHAIHSTARGVGLELPAKMDLSQKCAKVVEFLAQSDPSFHGGCKYSSAILSHDSESDKFYENLQISFEELLTLSKGADIEVATSSPDGDRHRLFWFEHFETEQDWLRLMSQQLHEIQGGIQAASSCLESPLPHTLTQLYQVEEMQRRAERRLAIWKATCTEASLIEQCMQRLVEQRDRIEKVKRQQWERIVII